MSSGGSPLFAPAALSILDRMPFDPVARSQFEVMSGALEWPDEFPRFGSPEFAAVVRNCVHRYLLAYRASLTLGEERSEFRPVWEQVTRHAPNWPGLRPERRGEQARRRLRAALRRQEKCLSDLEAYLRAGRDGG